MKNTIVSFTVLLCLIFSAFPVFADDSGPVAAWDFDADMPDWASETLNLGSNNSKNGLGCDCAVIDDAAIYARALYITIRVSRKAEL